MVTERGKTSRREAKKRERRRAALEAAELLFSEKGFRNTTMQEIAERAGISKGGVYLYFKSKEELYLSVCLSALTGYGDRLTKAFNEARGLEGRIKAVFLAYVEHALEQPALFMVLRDTFIEQVRRNLSRDSIEQIENYIRQWLENGASLVREGIDSGAFSPRLDPYGFSLMCWRLATSLVELALLDDLLLLEPSRITDICESAIDLIIRGARTGGAAGTAKKTRPRRDRG